MIFRRLSECALLLTLGLTVAACGSEPAEPPAESMPAEEPPAAAEPMSSTPRVFFVEPQDGATVTSPVRLVFGSEGTEIAAVPATVDQVRPGMGHYHVAIDAPCLPAGTLIEKAAPWVHFGDGKNEIEMQMPAGQHTLTLQLGDDAHMTSEGMCQTITVTVTE